MVKEKKKKKTFSSKGKHKKKEKKEQKTLSLSTLPPQGNSADFELENKTMFTTGGAMPTWWDEIKRWCRNVRRDKKTSPKIG